MTTPDEWASLFELSDRHGFVIAADECYSEIYFDEAAPPLGALAVGAGAGPRRLPAPRLVRQPVQALQRTGAALRLRRRRRRAGEGVPALPHLSRLGDVARPSPRRASPRGTTKRTCAPTARKYAAKFARAAAAARVGPARARCPTPRSTCGRATPIDDADVRAAAARRAGGDRAARQLPRARRPRHEPRPRLRAHRAGREQRRVRARRSTASSPCARAPRPPAGRRRVLSPPAAFRRRAAPSGAAAAARIAGDAPRPSPRPLGSQRSPRASASRGSRVLLIAAINTGIAGRAVDRGPAAVLAPAACRCSASASPSPTASTSPRRGSSPRPVLRLHRRRSPSAR